MAEGSSTGNISGESSNSSVELKIKTLDSRIFSFQVQKNMTVSLFKEKIATEVGVPVGQQRLIFRGKVLKDDHPLSEYHIENGDTLHLVERQPAQTQASSDASAGVTNGNSNRGTDGGTGNGRNRIGHISHSVVLGTFNVGDQAQGEGAMPDLSRVIGAVLNSFGVGGQPTTNASNSSPFPSSASQGNETNGARGSTNSQSQTGNQTQSAQSFPGFISQQSSPQVVQIPVTAAVPLPSFHSPIPDSLRTVSEFIVRMEQALTQNGSNASSGNAENSPRVELPYDIRGLPTVEGMSIVLRQMQQLLGSHTVNAISHISDRLERERDSSDPTVRGEIQTEAVRVGLAMQHLGALLLELGRTMLTMRMGQSPVESSINAGPAVYISQTGPNPIMVQPFPLQTSSLFSGLNVPPNPATSGPVGIGHAPRHINIHIHAGTSLAPVVSGVDSRASTGEGTQGERGSNISSGSMRVLPVRNVIPTTAPVRPSGSGIAPGAQPAFHVATSQPPSNSSIANSVAEVNSLIRDLVNNAQGGSQVASGNGRSNDATVRGAGPGVTLPIAMAEPEEQKKQCNEASNDEMTSSSSEVPTEKSEGPSGSGSRSSEDNAKSVPLGLGLGGLERKRPTKKPSTAQDQNLNARTVGQQLLHSFASRNAATTRAPVSEAPSTNPVVGNSISSGGQAFDNPVDAADAVSQVLQSPALNGLLAGFSEQTGVGSPDMLRNMLQQLTQSPQIMNTVSQIAQQVDGQDLGNMFSGLGGAQGGGLDLSQMVQQMMPVVSRAFSRGPNAPQPFPVMEPESQTNYDARRSGETNNPNSQIDAQEIAERVVEHSDSPGEVFRAVAENAILLNAGERSSEDLLKELLGDDDLTNEYTQLLQRDLRRRFDGDSSDS